MRRLPGKKKRTALGLAAIVSVSLTACTPGSPGTPTPTTTPWWASQPHSFQVQDDSGTASADGVVHGNVLTNDGGATAVVRSGSLDDPSAGSLDVEPDGDYTFTPATPGAHGTVHFTYGATDGVQLYQTNLPPIDTFGSVKISGGSFGSSWAPAPGRPGFFYGITDRGPNADSGDGNQVEPDSGVDPAHPTFHPQIGLFQLVGGTAQ
jgi:hypothetical protein